MIKFRHIDKSAVRKIIYSSISLTLNTITGEKQLTYKQLSNLITIYLAGGMYIQDVLLQYKL